MIKLFGALIFIKVFVNFLQKIWRELLEEERPWLPQSDMIKKLKKIREKH